MKTVFTPSSLTWFFRFPSKRYSTSKIVLFPQSENASSIHIRNNVRQASETYCLSIVDIGRGGLSVRDWRGVHRLGVVSTSKWSFRAPRNGVVDIVHRDDAFVIHRQARIGVVKVTFTFLTRTTSWKRS